MGGGIWRHASVIMLLLVSGIAGAQVIEEWAVRYDGRGSGPDQPTAMVIDRDDYIYLTGFADRAQHPDYEDWDFTTIKYDLEGNLIWRAVYYVTMDEIDQPCDMALDPDGNVVVTGTVCGYTGDWGTVKYDSDGNLLWSRQFSSPGHNHDEPCGLDIDAAGNIYVGGVCFLTDDKNFTIVKYNPDGHQQWVTEIHSDVPGSWNQAIDLAIDGDGNAILTGYGDNESYYPDIVTAKVDADGDSLWFRRWTDPTPDYYGSDPIGIAVDEAGNIYIGGMTFVAFQGDFLFLKYDPEGNLLWETRCFSAAESHEEAYAFHRDAEGNLYLTGETGVYPTDPDIYTAKVDCDGNVIWSAPFAGQNGQGDIGRALTTDSEGALYVACETEWETWSDEYLMLKYDPDGHLIWEVTRTDTGYHSDQPAAIAINSRGDLLITGNSYGSETYDDYLTVMYSQPMAVPGEETHPAQPVEHLLLSAYPNPFNATTVAGFDLQVASHISLAVYDIAGQELARLVDGWREAGRHSVTFDGGDLPSGIYLLRLTAGNSIAVQKMVLLK